LETLSILFGLQRPAGVPHRFADIRTMKESFVRLRGAGWAVRPGAFRQKPRGKRIGRPDAARDDAGTLAWCGIVPFEKGCKPAVAGRRL